jgi:serine phosphatase RsbU (regulator of sigma subunit)
MGHGIASVTAMAQIRTMVRTSAWAGLTPDAVLRLTDQLANESGLTEMATVFYGNLRTAPTGMNLTYSNAGHPYALLRRPNGEVTELSNGRRPLIGVLDVDADPSQENVGTIHLPPESLLLLYTDGLIERQGIDDNEAAAALRTRLSLIGRDDSLDELRKQLLSSPNANDDTTIFAVRIGGSS